MEREISPFLGLTEAEEHEILGPAPHSVRSRTEDSDAKTVEEARKERPPL